MTQVKTESREEWVQARRALLAREKAFTREADALARARRSLPWLRVRKPYAFDGPQGREKIFKTYPPKVKK